MEHIGRVPVLIIGKSLHKLGLLWFLCVWNDGRHWVGAACGVVFSTTILSVCSFCCVANVLLLYSLILIHLGDGRSAAVQFVTILGSGAGERLGHDGEDAVFERVERSEVEQKAEDALPYEPARRPERVQHDLVHLSVLLNSVALILLLPKLILQVLSLLLLEIHHVVPAGGEAVRGKGPLHFFGVEEVKVSPEEFSSQLLRS